MYETKIVAWKVYVQKKKKNAILRNLFLLVLPNPRQT